MLHPSCVPNPAPRCPRQDSNGTYEVTQKTLTEKATGQKRIIVCLYFSRKIHPISPTFIKLILKTVNGSCVYDIKRKAVQVIYKTVIEKMLTYKWKHDEGRF